jgi:hypothetical protein
MPSRVRIRSTSRSLTLAAVLPVLGLVAFATACESPLALDSGPAGDLRGTWSYTGARTSAGSGDIEGTVTISTQTGPEFRGTAELTWMSGPAAGRRLTGVIHGSALDGGFVDFNAILDGVRWRHVGVLEGDAMNGNWLEDDGAGDAGWFQLKRRGDQ